MKISDKKYEVLRFISETLIPSITTFIGVILIAINCEYAEVIITIMAGFDAMIGGIVRKLRNEYNKTTEESEGA